MTKGPVFNEPLSLFVIRYSLFVISVTRPPTVALRITGFKAVTVGQLVLLLRSIARVVAAIAGAITAVTHRIERIVVLQIFAALLESIAIAVVVCRAAGAGARARRRIPV